MTKEKFIFIKKNDSQSYTMPEFDILFPKAYSRTMGFSILP